MTSPLPGYASHFGLANIPFGVASSQLHPSPQCVTRYEDSIIFLAELSQNLASIADLPHDVFTHKSLNAFAALDKIIHLAVRERIQHLLRTSGIPSSAIEPIAAVTMHLPVHCGDFSDFSCSAHHVENASEAMTGKRSHPPSFYHQPVGYAGRCSSLDISGTSQVRPWGHFWAGAPGQSDIVFGPSRRMDFELELAAVVGKPVNRREGVLAREAEQHIFGFVLVNDWSGKLTCLRDTSRTTN